MKLEELIFFLVICFVYLSVIINFIVLVIGNIIFGFIE